MPPLRHDCLTNRSLKRKYSEYRSASAKEADHGCQGNTLQIANATSELPRLRVLPPEESCWRCKSEGIECHASPGKPCMACIAIDDPRFGACMRSETLDIIANGVPDMPGLGSDEWLFSSESGKTFQVRMEYPDDARRRIRDLDEFTSEDDSILHRKEAILVFIEQFKGIDNRWQRWYEETTVELIELCVTVQHTVLTEYSGSWGTLDTPNTVIATGLRALALTHQLSKIDGNVPWGQLAPFDAISFAPECFSEEDPRIEISQVKNEMKQESSKDSKLPDLLKEIHRVTRMMLFRHESQDSPILLCSLILMKLVHQNLSLRAFDGFRTKECNASWKTYCKMFDELAGPFHPLVENWDKSEYVEVLGHEQNLSVHHFEILHGIWIDFEEYCRGQTFPERLDTLISGYMMVD